MDGVITLKITCDNLLVTQGSVWVSGSSSYKHGILFPRLIKDGHFRDQL